MKITATGCGKFRDVFVVVIRSDTDWIQSVLQKDKTKAQTAFRNPLFKGKLSNMKIYKRFF